MIDETEYQLEKSNLRPEGGGRQGLVRGLLKFAAKRVGQGWMSHKMSHMSPPLPPPAAVIVSAAALQNKQYHQTNCVKFRWSD